MRLIDTKAEEVAQPNLQPTCNQLATDCISRQAAIAETWKEPTYTDPQNVLTEIRDRLYALPSADVVEVVRCKDCKNSKHWYRDRRRCFLWSEDGVSVFDDGFCNYGEQSGGEQNGTD